MSVGNGEGGQGGRASLDFIHGTDIVDKGLIILFFGIFAIFGSFASVAPPHPESFSADALVHIGTKI